MNMNQDDPFTTLRRVDCKSWIWSIFIISLSLFCWSKDSCWTRFWPFSSTEDHFARDANKVFNCSFDHLKSFNCYKWFNNKFNNLILFTTKLIPSILISSLSLLLSLSLYLLQHMICMFQLLTMHHLLTRSLLYLHWLSLPIVHSISLLLNYPHITCKVF